MRSVTRPPVRLVLVTGLALASSVAPAAHAASPAAASRQTAPVPATAPVASSAPARVAELSAERLEMADKVAAAKWGTDQAIDDPGREQAVLDDVAERSAARGMDPAGATAVFRDQIEANKLVQRGLHARWEERPSERPAGRPDLAEEVRPVLDRITGQLLTALRHTEERRHDAASCSPELALSAVRTARARGFDALHQTGLARAVPAVCGRP